jgi:hypothetical protein
MIPRSILKAKESGPLDRPPKKVRFEMADDCPSTTSVKLMHKKTVQTITGSEKRHPSENPAPRAPMVEATNKDEHFSPKTSFNSPMDIYQKENLTVDANSRIFKEQDDDMRFGRPGSKRAAFLEALSTVLKAVFKPKPCTDSTENGNKSVPASDNVVSESTQPEIAIDKPKIPATQADEEEDAGSHA